MANIYSRFACGNEPPFDAPPPGLRGYVACRASSRIRPRHTQAAVPLRDTITPPLTAAPCTFYFAAAPVRTATCHKRRPRRFLQARQLSPFASPPA